VDRLVGLKKLILSGNEGLRSLPAGRSSLVEWEKLDLFDCGLEELPNAIGGLIALKTLRLAYNGVLRSLPTGLAQLEHLTALDISNCPSLVTLHQLNCLGGVRAVQGFLRDLTDMQGDLFEPSLRNSLKLLLVGPTEAGKTSLLRALIHGEQRVLADRDTERTIGLDIHRLLLADPLGRMGGDAPVVLVSYDAGGHGEYQELHQAFFSTGIYLLLWDVSKSLSKQLIGELCRWVTSIQGCTPGATVLLVGSHADEAESAEAVARSCADVLQRLQDALAADEGRLGAELEWLDPNGELRRVTGLKSGSHGELSAETRQVAHLGRLLASPLRLSERVLTVSAETLQNVELLREQLLDAAFDKAAFPEFGSEQPWAYAAIARRLVWVAAAGSPLLTWAELQDILQSAREPPKGVAIEVKYLGSSLEGTGPQGKPTLCFFVLFSSFGLCR
jgi:hypothetical protein